MIPEKGHKKSELKLLYTSLEFKNVCCFSRLPFFLNFLLFLVEISCSIQYKYLQDEPLPLPDPQESQITHRDHLGTANGAVTAQTPRQAPGSGTRAPASVLLET